MHDMERINRRTWRDPLALRDYRRSAGYLNEGEREALALAATVAPGRRVLDIGIGTGRTTAFLEPVSADYVGIDYTPEMIGLARRNHPGLRLETMDARDLSAFADNSFDLVFFSYNGIDSVDPEGRAKVFAAVSRVLAPGGVFVFSTFHRDWKGFDQRVDYRRLSFTANPVRLGLRLALYCAGSAAGYWRRRRYAALERRDGEHAIILHGAHDFGILVYATTAKQVEQQMASAGFDAPAAYLDPDGARLSPAMGPDIEYFYVVAHKAAAIDAPLRNPARPAADASDRPSGDRQVQYT